jgi:hypothetical protein
LPSRHTSQCLPFSTVFGATRCQTWGASSSYVWLPYKPHHQLHLILDATYPNVYESQFHQAYWTECYRDAAEAIPPNALEPRGNFVIISCFVDADHAGNLITRHSHTGIIIFCNCTPIIWFSKRQNTVENSAFGSEFIDAKIAVQLIESL